MTHELVQLSSGELKRLQGALHQNALAGPCRCRAAARQHRRLRQPAALSITQCLQRWEPAADRHQPWQKPSLG